MASLDSLNKEADAESFEQSYVGRKSLYSVKSSFCLERLLVIEHFIQIEYKTKIIY